MKIELEMRLSDGQGIPFETYSTNLDLVSILSLMPWLVDRWEQMGQIAVQRLEKLGYATHSCGMTLLDLRHALLSVLEQQRQGPWGSPPGLSRSYGIGNGR